MGSAVEPVMTGCCSLTVSVASLLCVVVIVSACRIFTLCLSPRDCSCARKLRGFTPVSPEAPGEAPTVQPAMAPEKPVMEVPPFGAVPTCSPRAWTPLWSLSVSVTSAITTWIETWAKRTSILSTMPLIRRMSS